MRPQHAFWIGTTFGALCISMMGAIGLFSSDIPCTWRGLYDMEHGNCLRVCVPSVYAPEKDRSHD